MLTLKQFKLSDINSSLSPMQLLYEIFTKTLNPALTLREFRQYYFSQHPDEMDITLIYNKELLVGFYSAAFYPRKIDGKKVVICRSALGMLKSQPKGQFPLGKLFAKFIAYKTQHPFTPLYITGFMANPLIYAMICKYTQTVYPRRNTKTPNHIIDFKSSLLESMGLAKKELAPFVLKIHFQVQFTESDRQRFENSHNPDVLYYLNINPGYCQQEGVMVILPVTGINMLYTCSRHLVSSINKKIKRLSGNWFDNTLKRRIVNE